MIHYNLYGDVNKFDFSVRKVISSILRTVKKIECLDSEHIMSIILVDNKIYYSANLKHPFSHALIELFTSKNVDVKDKEVIRRNSWDDYIKPVKNYLDALIVTNRLPGQGGIDMLIIGDDKTKKLTHWAEVIEKKMGKPLNYVILGTDDFSYRKSVRDRFLIEVMEMETSEVYDPEKLIRG